MSPRLLSLVVAVLLLAPATVRAVTVDDIIAMSKSGVGDSVLIALIDADQTVFHLTPGQIVELKRAGVSDHVVVKMIDTARQFEGRGQTPLEPEQASSVVIIGEKPPSPQPAPDWPFTAVPPWWPVPMTVPGQRPPF